MNMIGFNKNKNYLPRRVDLFSEVGRDLDQVFNEIFGTPFYYKNGKKRGGHPLLDAVRSKNKLIFQYAVPGVKLDDLNIEISKDEQGSLLSVYGKLSSNYTHKENDYQIRELSSQEFRRVIRLPEDVVEDDPEANLRDGILTLVFNTKSNEDVVENSVKKISIKS